VIDFDPSAFSAENQLPAGVFQLRARIALGKAGEVLADLDGEDDGMPDVAAVKALALLAAGEREPALAAAKALAEKEPENGTVQVLCGTVLQAEGQSEDALALLAKHQGNLEACVSIYLSFYVFLTSVFAYHGLLSLASL
jgi:coatomer subunit epsilon